MNINLCEKLVSWLQSPIIFDETSKATLLPFSVSDVDMLSYELNIFTFQLLY